MSCVSKFRRDERGQTVILVAVAIVVLIGFLALVADVGQFYLTRSRLQAAADSAALAAAQDLAEGRSELVAREAAINYADRNLDIDHDITVTFIETEEEDEDGEEEEETKDIRVRIQAVQRTFFGAVFGRTSAVIHASALAGFAPVSSVRDTVPIIVPWQAIGDHVGSEHEATFGIGQDNSDAGQKGFFWLANFSDEGVGTPVFADWIINGYPEPVEVGNVGAGEGMKAALDAALAQRMATDPSVIVPLYDFTEASGGNKNYHVVGFAEFVITGFNFQGGDKNIRGYFTTGTLVDGETTVQPPRDYGINAVRLKG